MASSARSGDRDFIRNAELALLNAPFEENGWRKALGLLATASRARGANLVCLGGSLPSLNLIAGFDQSEIHSSFSDPILWGRANWRVGTTTRPGEFQHDGDYALYREQVNCDDYADVVEAIDMPFGCQTVFSMDDSGFVGLALMRGRADGPCDELSLNRFKFLSAVAARALKLQLALDGQAAELMLADPGISGFTFLLDRHRVIGAATQAADSLLGDGPFKAGSVSLVLEDPSEDRLLRRTLSLLLNAGLGDGSPMVRQLVVGRTAERPAGRWRLIVARLPGREHCLGFDPHFAVTVQPL